jgi:hypothetical protein
MRIFGQLLLVDKQKVPYLYKTTSSVASLKVYSCYVRKFQSIIIIHFFRNSLFLQQAAPFTVLEHLEHSSAGCSIYCSRTFGTQFSRLLHLLF